MILWAWFALEQEQLETHRAWRLLGIGGWSCLEESDCNQLQLSHNSQTTDQCTEDSCG